MQAVTYAAYGSPDVLKLQAVPKPAPQAGEVLIKVHAAGVNAADWHLMRGEPFLVRFSYGLRKPKHPILGYDVAGVVEAVGEGVTQWKPGDAVFGDISASGGGGFAEYVCAPASVLAPKPANLSFEQAAAVPLAAVTALQGLRDLGKLKAGQKVLIVGASGGVGTFAVQLAKLLGAEVTAVCSTRHVQLVRSLGADHVIDYTREDFARNGQQYDLILAVNGNRSISDYQRSLRPQGIYVAIGGSMTQLFQAMLLGPLLSMRSGKKMGNLMAKANPKDLLLLKEWLEAGKIAPVIDRCYPLSEVPNALRYMEEGHAQGKVVISM
jgi:NADPH:quinone reductase-like Zn-dependent oxidoreductase